jgi:hypothetical protein
MTVVGAGLAGLLVVATCAATTYWAVKQRVAIRRSLRGGGRGPDRILLPGGMVLPRLMFPLVSLLPGTGRTSWSVMLWNRVTSADYPVCLGKLNALNPQRSDTAEEVIRGILSGALSQSVTNVPTEKPLDFFLADSDPLGASECCVSIQNRGDVVAPRKHRDSGTPPANDHQGLLVFLDPSRVADSHKQQFFAVLGKRLEPPVRRGNSRAAPVAICVTKIDLLVNQRYAEGDAVWRFYTELGDIGWGMDVESIDCRSDCVRRLCDTVWPGWEIERTLADRFGGRCMFFPLTPIGLDEPGETDLSKRNLAPVGILHPLMWLVHMNGYIVLPKRSTR